MAAPPHAGRRRRPGTPLASRPAGSTTVPVVGPPTCQGNPRPRRLPREGQITWCTLTCLRMQFKLGNRWYGTVGHSTEARARIHAHLQVGHMVYAFVKRTPSRASWSSTGVLMIVLPAMPRASQRCWSDMIRSRLCLGDAPSATLAIAATRAIACIAAEANGTCVHSACARCPNSQFCRTGWTGGSICPCIRTRAFAG